MRFTAISFGLALALTACASAPPPPPAEPQAQARKSEWAQINEDTAPGDEADAKDDGVKVEGALGTLDAGAVDDALRRATTQVNTCYQEGLSRFRYLAGRVEVKAKVQKDGSIKSIIPVAVLGDREVERCILDAVKKQTYPSPKGGAEAEFEYAWEFRAKAPLQEWDQDRVSTTFTKHRGDLRACESKGSVPPGLRVVFYVTPGGKVASVGIGADAALDEAYASCVAQKVAGWKFADPEGRVARAMYQF